MKFKTKKEEQAYLLKKMKEEIRAAYFATQKKFDAVTGFVPKKK